jgi:hypothetical protein
MWFFMSSFLYEHLPPPPQKKVDIREKFMFQISSMTLMTAKGISKHACSVKENKMPK